MRRLKTEREVIDFVNSLTPDEAKAILQMFNESPEIMRALRTEGVVMKIVQKRKQRAAPPKHAGSKGGVLTMGEFLALDLGEGR